MEGRIHIKIHVSFFAKIDKKAILCGLFQEAIYLRLFFKMFLSAVAISALAGGDNQQLV